MKATHRVYHSPIHARYLAVRTVRGAVIAGCETRPGSLRGLVAPRALDPHLTINPQHTSTEDRGPEETELSLGRGLAAYL